MPSRRVLILGITGVAKREAVTRMAEFCANGLSRDCHPIDFESDWLFRSGKHGVNRETFLDAEPTSQRASWEKAWDHLWNSDLSARVERNNEDIFLGMHGCYIRGHYGSRCVLDFQKVAAFRPHVVLTLIADVYDMWWTTEARANGEAWKGQPTLEHLLLGRRTEVMIADAIALASDTSPRSLVIGVGHPLETVARCIYRNGLRIGYLSFPISEPRRMAAAGEMAGIFEVSRFIEQAQERQRQAMDLALICPLAIDELPFAALKDARTEFIEFDRDSQRWDLAEFWPIEARLAPPTNVSRPIPTAQLRDAAGTISTDVGWRDFRLVEQSDRLAVFDPVFNDRGSVSRGVANEVSHAVRLGHPVYIYQDPRHDTKGALNRWLDQMGGGTMGLAPSSRLITVKQSIAEMMDAIVA